MKICFLPIDNRPVCYLLPSDIAQIDTDIELILPPREYLGDLKKNAQVENLFAWLKSLSKVDSIILSLDTIAYGGLIPSRRSSDSFETIKTRIDELRTILLEKVSQGARVYAFSSIMRISNNNVNEEEKEYWAQWGKKLFDYSYHSHKCNGESCIKQVIPSEIIDDYLDTRKRNFEINKIYLQWQKDGIFDTLIFSKDDCAEYGFNVLEAQELEKLGGYTKTGADEIPLALFARAVQGSVKIAPIFLAPEHKGLISKYEDVSIEKSVISQIELAGCEVSDVENCDIALVVNNFEQEQGEIVMNIPTKPFEDSLILPLKPVMFADVRYANGADNMFLERVLAKIKTSYGYSAWNTSANTLGSLICGAKVKFLAKRYDNKAFLKLQTIRLLDDWAYQANIRQILRKGGNSEIKNLMKPYEDRILSELNFKFDVEYMFPWTRLFEIECLVSPLMWSQKEDSVELA